jgi:uncharacterized protein YutE (UPF0331/DUF86 family)
MVLGTTRGAHVAFGASKQRLAARLAAMARLRNLLVHGYGRVDDERLHKIIREDLGDLDDFLKAVSAYIEAEEKPS